MKKVFYLAAAVILALGALTACSRNEENGGTQSGSAGSTTTQTEQNGQAADDTAEGTPVEVPLDERNEEAQYTYTEEDLSMVDTTTGKRITLGMNIADVEAITGEPITIDQTYRIYDGIVVNYRDDTAAVLIVARGNMTEGSDPGRYVTTRGVSLSTSVEDFYKAYGTSASADKPVAEEGQEAPVNSTGATRYLQKDGDQIKYLGTDLTQENRPEDLSTLYLQDFIFNSETGLIDSIRVGDYNMIMNGR